MPMTVRTESGHVLTTNRAKALKLIEQGAQQVADGEAELSVEVAAVVADDEVETTEVPAMTTRRGRPRKAPAAD